MSYYKITTRDLIGQHIAPNSPTHPGPFLSLEALNLKLRESKDSNQQRKWPKTAQHRLLLACFNSIQYTDRLGTLRYLKKRYQAFILKIL